ncbi:unnamed protein product [Wuchereria bancrofti]|uniref:Uncharacterized protein n=1 Tax=Wuchereria bancrofti TaxID=6293 RepID=A0A3P7DQI7_WUCBA|nr:unnamed protein product [Wuchereria bancrofti]
MHNCNKLTLRKLECSQCFLCSELQILSISLAKNVIKERLAIIYVNVESSQGLTTFTGTITHRPLLDYGKLGSRQNCVIQTSSSKPIVSPTAYSSFSLLSSAIPCKRPTFPSPTYKKHIVN